MALELDMSEYMSNFIEDMKDLLESLDNGILQLEKNSEDKNNINEIFRIAHSMKGMAATMGFVKMANLTHNMEDLLHDIREGKVKPDKKLVDLMLICHDYLQNSLEYIIANNSEKQDVDFSNLIDKLHNIIEEKPATKISVSEFKLKDKDLKRISETIEDGKTVFIIEAKIDRECMLRGARSYMALELMNKNGEIIKSIPDFEDLKEGNTDYDIQAVKAVIATKKGKEFYKKSIMDISEFESVEIEKFAAEKIAEKEEAVKKQTEKLRDMEKSILTVSDITSEFDEAFRNEILKNCQDLEDALILLKDSPKDIRKGKTVFRTFHSIRGIASLISVETIENIAKESERVVDDIRKMVVKPDEIIVSLLMNSVEYIRSMTNNPNLIKNEDFSQSLKHHITNLINRRIDIDTEYKKINSNSENKAKPEKKPGTIDLKVDIENSRIGTILIEQGTLSEDDVIDIMVKQKEEYKDLKFGEIAIKEKKVNEKDLTEALSAQKSKSEVATSYIRIPTPKLDNLVDMIGELMIIQSQIEQEASKFFISSHSFINNLVRMSRIIKDVQGLSMSLKMVSLQTTFQKINRVARDTAVELNKKVAFEFFGEETEIDRGVAERILDPLMHMVKNSVSHGIEDNLEDRRKLGKVDEGNIVVGAYNKRGNVYIEIEDDGRGINYDKVYKKALEKGLIDKNKNYSNEEIMNFIFLPGFSTAEVVNGISGRGVGMDVVRTEITRIGGKIEIENKEGYSCKFVLKIPINMAALNGTIVEINNEKYIIPTLYIKEIYKPVDTNWISVRGKRNMIKIREDVVPLIDFESFFGTPPNYNDGIIIILELENKHKALPVTNILGKSEIVVKSLGSEFNDLNFISGASILGDGKVSLILDVENLFK